MPPTKTTKDHPSLSAWRSTLVQAIPPTPYAWLRWIAAVMLVSLAGIRAVISFAPASLLTVLPAADTAAAFIGPVGIAITDWLCVLVLLLALVDRLLTRGKTHWGLVVLWMIGGGFALAAGLKDYDSLRIGGMWAGMLALGLAALHLAGYAEVRRLILAAMIALILPLSVQALYQVTVGHAITVAQYEQNREMYLRRRGWAPGSVEQRRFEERLYQLQASARMNLANVFGTLMMSLTLIALGGAMGTFRRTRGAREDGEGGKGEDEEKEAGTEGMPRRGRTRTLVIAVLVLLGTTALALTFSKGAIGSLLVAGGATGAAWFLGRRIGWGRYRWWWRTLAFLVVAAGILGVIARGMLGPPETAAGERSLLFRYQYWQAATEIWLEHPITGVAPGRFKQAYLIHKSPLNPEAVAKPHNVFVTYISTLGLGGVAWSMLVLALLWHAGARVCERLVSPRFVEPVGRNEGGGGEGEGDPQRTTTAPAAASAPTPSSLRPSVPSSLPLPPLLPPSAAIAIGVLIFALAYAIHLRMLGGAGLAIVTLGAVLMGVGYRVVREGRRAIGAAVILGAAVAAVVLLPAAGLWLISAAGFTAVAAMLSREGGLDSRVAALGLFAAAMGLLLHAQVDMSLTHVMAGPALFVILGTAAAPSVPSSLRPSVSSGQHNGRTRLSPTTAAAATALAAALLIMLATHVIPIIRHQSAMVAATRALQRGRIQMALRRLEAAQQLPSPDPRLAIRQAKLLTRRAVAAHRARRLELREQWFEAAIAELQQAARTGSRLREVWRARMEVAATAARLTHQPRWIEQAIAAAKRMLDYTPYSIYAHLAAADLAWQLGRRAQAAQWYQRTLELNQLSYLSPLRQLRGEDLQRARQRAEWDETKGQEQSSTRSSAHSRSLRGESDRPPSSPSTTVSSGIEARIV